jgi:predicted RNA-binding Zn ribbon-like protein
MKLLCLSYINSQWYIDHELFEDPLLNQEWMDYFCAEWHLPVINTSTSENINDLIQLRIFLNQTAREFIITRSINSLNLAKINRLLSERSFHKELLFNDGQYFLEVVPDQSDKALFMAQIVASFAEIITQYNPERMKLCQNPACGWIFYDESRGSTRKWCDNTCASLMKVRRFRAAKKILSDQD